MIKNLNKITTTISIGLINHQTAFIFHHLLIQQHILLLLLFYLTFQNYSFFNSKKCLYKQLYNQILKWCYILTCFLQMYQFYCTDMVFLDLKKRIAYFLKKIHLLFVIFVILLTQYSCVRTTEEHISLFENYLESFMGKKVKDVINSMGQPTSYKNRMDLPGEQSGTYMIYDYRNEGNNCIIMFKYAKSTLQIIDWDYEGNCLLLDESLFKSW